MTTMTINTKVIKAQIREDLNLKVMVRKDGTNKVSVWLFPADRNDKNRTSLEDWFNVMEIERCSYDGVTTPICVNGGEYNSLIWAL